MSARMRVLMTLGILLAAAVTAATTVPVGVDEIGQIARGTLAEAWGVPGLVVILAWAMLALAVTLASARERRPGATSGAVAALAVVLGLASAIVAVRGAWLNVSTFDMPQTVQGSLDVWGYGSAAVIAIAAAVVFVEKDGRLWAPGVIGRWTTAWATACVVLLPLAWGHQVLHTPGGAPLAVALGVTSLAAGVALGIVTRGWWRRDSSNEQATMRKRTTAGIATVALIIAIGWALIGLFVYFAVGGGLTLSGILAVPALFAVIALIPGTLPHGVTVASHPTIGHAAG
ncbi:MAG TPA: hypothetical protein VLB85_07940 [Acidimicrobiia bacterium]|nr:hypothetical protein [Acidimicrobiia bacterium]